MITKYLKKTITVFITFIFIFGLIPAELFSQPGPSFQPGTVKGFNISVFDTHFSRADREITPERWLSEAKLGILLALNAWELIAGNLFDNPLLLDEAKNQLVTWSNEELERRFSQWLIGRFFGEAAEKAVLEFSQMFGEAQKNFSWHLDEEGNILFDDKTGNPLIIRPGDYGREFSQDLVIWQVEAENLVDIKSSSFENALQRLHPELLAYIPVELRETMSVVIHESASSMSGSIMREFENIAAREERIFTSRRTRDIWSLRRRSDDEAARLFTQKLIAETEASCKNGIEELNIRIEQAEAGIGDLAIMGEEWLRLYREQFEKGLRAWEKAEERFFIRRIEWEQDSFRLFSEGEEIWLSAFNQFEEQRRLWELQVKELFQSGEVLFKNISEDLKRNIEAAKNEFELNMEMRIGEGTARVKALVDMYLVCASAAVSAMESLLFWQSQYGSNSANPKDAGYYSWLKEEQIKNPENSALKEMEKTYEMYSSYMEKALDTRNRIMENYSELLGTGILKDILSPDATSDDFCLDEYQIALIRAKALVLYWERKTEIAEAVITYAGELTAKRITEAEGLQAWESAKAAYTESLSIYEAELIKLNSISADIQNQQEVLNLVYQNMLREEARLNQLTSDYTTLVSVSVISRENYYIADFNQKYDNLVNEYKVFIKSGVNSIYKNALEYGLIFGISDNRERTEEFLYLLINGDGADLPSLEVLENNVNEGLISEVELRIRLAGIALFSPDSNSADWYLNARRIELAEEEKAALFGEKLFNRLIVDYNNISQLLDEIEIEFELHENSELYLEELYDEYYLSLGLLEMYILYSPFSSFVENEFWQDSMNFMAALFEDYGITPASGYLPDVQEICESIFRKPGNFTQNAYQFLEDFIDCFSIIPQWLEYELTIWIDSVLNYISAYVLYNGINLENSAMEFSENEKHWRQYLLDDYITKKDTVLSAASSWSEGNLADAYFRAVYHTNRINDSFELFSSRDLYSKDENADFYYLLYYSEMSYVDLRLNSLSALYNELAHAARSFEFSRIPSEEIQTQLAAYEEALIRQEEVYDLLRNEYFREVNIFINTGSSYDEQYKILKKAQDNSDQKRFEYEKQDAIQRWASTAYITAENIDLENPRKNLSRAQTVLNVLSDLYNNESERTYNNPEYDILYSAYEQSFSRKLKILEVNEILLLATEPERVNNMNIHFAFQRSLNRFGIFRQNYSDYFLPDSYDEWSIKHIVTVKDGLLAFTRDDSMKLTGLDSLEAEELEHFLNSLAFNEYNITFYEESLINLGERMAGYLTNMEKFTQWGLAREYLIKTLIENNSELNFLGSYSYGLGEMGSNRSMGSVYIKTEPLRGTERLSSYMYNSNIINKLEDDSRIAWEELSDQEKADLEFYIIMTLNSTNDDYFRYFAQVYALSVYEAAYNRVNTLYRTAKKMTDAWWYRPISAALHVEMRDVNRHALNTIRSPYETQKNIINDWISELGNNLLSIQTNALAYIQSSEKLLTMEGAAKTQNVEWEDIYDALSRTDKVNESDLASINSWWKLMQMPQRDNSIKLTTVPDALAALIRWAEDEERKNKRLLEEYWYNDSQNQQKYENNYIKAVDDYLAGDIGINELKAATAAAYGPAASAWKNHVGNLHSVLLNNLSMYLNTGANFYYEFSILGEEITMLTRRTLENRYNAELAARKTEWDQTLKDLTDKYNEWQASAALILENGRTDWITSRQKMEDAFHQWSINFQNEFNRVNDEWNIAYLAGLEDKERWLEQAANAADQASAESFLMLAGTEGERLARFVDTREPFGIRDSIPQAQTLMAELIQSSGIVNMLNAFSSLNNITGTASVQVRRGIGGISTWDTALVKTVAADFAKQANTEIANNEIRKLAYNARLYADEAIRGLAANVASANQSFRESMDNVFIFSGLWRKNGDFYVKDVLTGSTLFSPVVTKTVTVMGYEDYSMEPVTLQTNLDENYLAAFDSTFIMELLDNAMNEVGNIAAAIFGNGEDPVKIASRESNGEERQLSPGLFGTHIGYIPDVKNIPTGKDKSSIFNDYGSGQLGRLITEFRYWKIIDDAGNAELALAPWDKRMWDDDGSWFSAPSLRSVGQIAASVTVGIATGGLGFWATLGVTALVGSSSEILFGALDIAFEYKTFDEVALNVGKSIATSAVSGLTSGLFNGTESFSGLTKIATGSATGTVNDSFSKVLTQSIMKGLETTVSGLATSSINAITFNKNDGWGFNTGTFKAGTEKLWINSLSSMASTFTTTGLHAINSGWDLEKLTGFSKLNQSDLANFNNLVGSLAGQGVNYLFGEDFTLNVLNSSLFSKGNTGLVEVRFNKENNGAITQFGTGGANVSYDNLASSLRGINVWNTNAHIGKFTDNHKSFDSVISLRALYGYGDDVQTDLLWDIIKEDVIIDTSTSGDYDALTKNIDGNKVIYIANYEQGMDEYSQMRLGTILGHEAYRDGFGVGEIDASGNIVTKESNFNELKNASIGKIMMADRISMEYEMFYSFNGNLAFESILLNEAKMTGDYTNFNDYLEIFYQNDNDYHFISASTRGDYQNSSQYRNTPLFNAASQDRVDEINEERLLAAFDRYLLTLPENKRNDPDEWEAFINNEQLQKDNGFVKTNFISLHDYGCKFMVTKSYLEAITGNSFNTLDLHEKSKNLNQFSGTSLLSHNNVADIITVNSNGLAKVSFVSSGAMTVQQLHELEQSKNEYALILQIKYNGGEHYVAFSGIDFVYDNDNNPIGIDKIHVANPWNSNGSLGRISYDFSEITRWDLFLVTRTRQYPRERAQEIGRM